MLIPFPPLTLDLSIGVEQLHGVRRGGVWSFLSTVPDVAERWSGDTVTTNAVEDFTRHALGMYAAQVATVEALARPEGGAP